MPKMKTHKGAAKRVIKTGTGKLKRAKAYTGHNFWAKTQKQKRKLRKAGLISDGDMKRIKTLLPYI